MNKVVIWIILAAVAFLLGAVFVHDKEFVGLLSGARFSLGLAVLVTYLPASWLMIRTGKVSRTGMLALGIGLTSTAHGFFGLYTLVVQRVVGMTGLTDLVSAFSFLSVAGLALHLVASRSGHAEPPITTWIVPGVIAGCGSAAVLLLTWVL